MFYETSEEFRIISSTAKLQHFCSAIGVDSQLTMRSINVSLLLWEATMRITAGFKSHKKNSRKELDSIGRDSEYSNPVSTEVSEEERRHLIAESAYFRAERRSFVPGYELEDWLAAEIEIEKRLDELHLPSRPDHAPQ